MCGYGCAVVHGWVGAGVCGCVCVGGWCRVYGEWVLCLCHTSKNCAWASTKPNWYCPTL